STMPSYVVTGAARGIGFEFITQLSADSDNTVFAIVRNKATATKLSALPRNNVTVLEADITDAKALNLAADEVSKATGGKLDYLINNAAVSKSAKFTLDQFPSAEAVEEELLSKFKINVVGVVHTINAFLPLLRKGEVKKVIALSSGMGDLDLTLASEVSALGPTQEELEEYKELIKAIVKVAPDFKGPITPEESVKLQLKVIERWGVEETGVFVSHFGNKQWV
ncbi:hypothetical protein B0H11DRAFT_2066455, partial [Mycena galericulata]